MSIKLDPFQVYWEADLRFRNSDAEIARKVFDPFASRSHRSLRIFAHRSEIIQAPPPTLQPRDACGEIGIPQATESSFERGFYLSRKTGATACGRSRNLGCFYGKVHARWHAGIPAPACRTARCKKLERGLRWRPPPRTTRFLIGVEITLLTVSQETIDSQRIGR